MNNSKKTNGLPVENPDTYFNDWAFSIPKFYWDLFGLRRVSVLDVDKNKPLRDAFIKERVLLGVCKKEASRQATQEFRFQKLVWKKFDFDTAFGLEGYVFDLKNQPVRLQVVKENGEQIVLAVFDMCQNAYTNLISISTKHFELYMKTGDRSYITPYDVNLLSESDFKYELKRTVK